MNIIFKETVSESDYREVYPGLFIKKDIMLDHQYFNKKRKIIGFGMDARGQFDAIKYYLEDGDAYFKKLDRDCLPLHKIFMLSKKQLMENDIITALVFIEQGLFKEEFKRIFFIFLHFFPPAICILSCAVDFVLSVTEQLFCTRHSSGSNLDPVSKEFLLTSEYDREPGNT